MARGKIIFSNAKLLTMLKGRWDKEAVDPARKDDVFAAYEKILDLPLTEPEQKIAAALEGMAGVAKMNYPSSFRNAYYGFKAYANTIQHRSVAEKQEHAVYCMMSGFVDELTRHPDFRDGSSLLLELCSVAFENFKENIEMVELLEPREPGARDFALTNDQALLFAAGEAYSASYAWLGTHFQL